MHLREYERRYSFRMSFLPVERCTTRRRPEGEMECRLGDFTSSSLSLDQALALCPTDGRAREVSLAIVHGKDLGEPIVKKENAKNG